MLQMGFDVTSHDFWQAMKDLRMPVSYPESQIISYKTNNYGIVNNTVIDPVVSNIMLVNNSSIMSGKDGRSIMMLLPSLPDMILELLTNMMLETTGSMTVLFTIP